ncbi:hypothetical protein L0337_17735 [candidate division KSB1 bacterium]|nr:hypothetical protein [candidate division KSB1 bacterium]
MITRKKLYPGQPGTKKLMERYGENLLCVRYHDDPAGKRKLKTVELIVAETPWQLTVDEFPLSQIKRLWIPYDDLELQDCVKAAGGKWTPQEQIWKIAYGKILDLGLTDYMME